MFLVESLRRLWFLFLAFFRSKPEEHMSRTVLPMSSNSKTRVVGKPELLSPPHQRGPMQRRGSGSTTNCGRPAGSRSYPRSSHQDLDRLPSNGHPHSHQAFSAYSLILPNHPPPRPPRPQTISVSVSEEEFSTPVIPDVRLPSVIVTPCTPSTKAGRTYTRTRELDDLTSDENEESSGSSDANSCIASIDSNPFLSDPSLPVQKEFNLPPLGPGPLNYRHHRARSLTKTGRGLYHQRLSRSEHSIRDHQPATFSSLPRVPKVGTLTNPVKKFDSPLLIGNSVAPSPSKTTSSSPNVVWDSTSQAIPDQRIRSYLTSTSSEQSTDQTLVQNITLDATSASTRYSEDPKVGVTASCEAQPAVLAHTDATIISENSAPSNLTPSVLECPAPLGAVPYTEVFDLDAYFVSDSSLPSQSTLKSSLNASCPTTGSTENKNPFLIPTTPSADCSSSAIFVSPPQPLRRVSNISDTTASSTSIYTYSLSNLSTDTDESTSPNPRRFGLLHITDNGKKTKVTLDRDQEVKRYRDQYRPSAYSRSLAFVIESPTTSRKFTRKRESDGISLSDRSNKENKPIASTTTSKVPPPPKTTTTTSTSVRTDPSNTKIANPISPSLNPSCCPSHVRDNVQLAGITRPCMPALLIRELKPNFQNPRVNYTPDSSTTAASIISPAGKNIATRHRLGSVAISQRRKL